VAAEEEAGLGGGGGGGEDESLVVEVDGAILVRGLSALGLDDGGGGGGGEDFSLTSSTFYSKIPSQWWNISPVFRQEKTLISWMAFKVYT